MSDIKRPPASFPLATPPGDWSAYEERIERVVAYLHQHLDEPLDLDRLAEIACLSRFHWHRIYRAIQGETAAQTLKRVRMMRAGFDLAEGTLSLDAIARRWGYPSRRSFSRAFADVFGMSPGEYRASAAVGPSRQNQTWTNTTMYDVTVETLPERQLIGLRHKGSYQKIGESFEKLVGLFATRNLMPHVRGMVGIYYDDPMAVPQEELRAHAAFVVEDGSLASAPLEAEVLAGGTYAVLTMKGPYSDLQAAYDWFYSVWLRENNKTIRSAPPYEDYVNNPREVPASELLTKICVPIEA